MVAVCGVRSAGRGKRDPRSPQRALPGRDLLGLGWSFISRPPHLDGVVLCRRGFDRLAAPREPHRLDLLGRRLLLWARERRRRVRDLCAPHQFRRSPIGSGSVLARAVDLGPRSRPDPGVPAAAVPRRSPAFASLAPGGLARRPLHRPGCRVVGDTALAREGSSASDRR
jgi:hypothetical protein